jgi:hypothetical protein
VRNWVISGTIGMRIAKIEKMGNAMEAARRPLDIWPLVRGLEMKYEGFPGAVLLMMIIKPKGLTGQVFEKASDRP